ncbi:MAG: sigma-70 family RNA polymerase sigma factor [Acidobacteria bacterium]|nr:sigma-70 family RNA polymerase sigma factor [Acidobacteriota bacterium]
MMDDTAIGGPARGFPATRWSPIVRARSEDPEERARALESIIAAYWKPVYKYIRARWGKSNEDAKDLTQEFFARLIEKDFLEHYDPEKARLRTFFRTCVDGVVGNQDRAARRLKRGGDAPHLSLDFETAESELARVGLPAPGCTESMEEFFEKEWMRSLFSLAVESLRQECEARGKTVHLRLFERYDLDDGDVRQTYSDLAREFGLSTSEVTNYLAFARREFRRISLEKLCEATSSEEEFRREARSLFGVDPE